MNRICSKCMTRNGCLCLENKLKNGHTAKQEIQVRATSISVKGAALVKFKKHIIDNGFEIPSGFQMWFKPDEWYVGGSGTTQCSSKIIQLTNSALNRVIKDVNLKRLKGIL